MRPRLARRGERRNVFFRVAELVQLQCGPGSLAGENESQLHRRNPATRASMRPRLARRGEPNDATTVVATTRSFNAAPARSPGRTSTRVKARRDVDMLQCGPGSLAGENVNSYSTDFSLGEASMRPRLARRGEPRAMAGRWDSNP